jgi:hypothetical protein
LEILYQQIVLGLFPQPTQIPPQPFDKEALQRAFLDLTGDYTYQQFVFTPNGGAQVLGATPDDGITIEPGLIQVRTPVAMTKELAATKVTTVLASVCKRMDIQAFVSGGMKVIAHAPIPTGYEHAQQFVGEKLMHSEAHPAELGPKYFAGGVKYRSIDNEARREENLLIEPLIRDPVFLFIDYDVQRAEQLKGTAVLSQWLDDAFGFIDGNVRRLLEA